MQLMTRCPKCSSDRIFAGARGILCQACHAVTTNEEFEALRDQDPSGQPPVTGTVSSSVERPVTRQEAVDARPGAPGSGVAVTALIQDFSRGFQR